MIKFSKAEAIRFGWDTMKKNLGFFIGILIVVGLFGIVPEIIRKLYENASHPLLYLPIIIFYLLQMVIGLGLIKIVLSFCDNVRLKFITLFSCTPLFFKYLISAVLYGLIVTAGILLFVVPGIIWAIRFQFFSYFIVDKGYGPVESLKRSYSATEGTVWNLFLFGLLLMGINILGVLALLIGLFATIPMSIVATAFVYRKLLAHMEMADITEESRKKSAKSITKILIITSIVIIPLLFGIWHISRDVPAPQDNDLQVTRIEIPEKENAFYYFKSAVEKRYFPEEKKDVIDNIVDGKEWNSDFVKELMKKNKESFYYFDEAVNHPDFQVPKDYEVDSYAGWQSITKLVSIKAMYFFKQGKEQKAFAETMKLIKQGHSIQNSQSQSGFVYYFIGWAMEKQGLQRLRMMLKNTTLPSNRLSDYIKELGQFKTHEQAFTQAVKIDYNYVYDLTEFNLKPYSKKSRASFFFYKPNKTKKMFAERYRGMIENVSKPCHEIRYEKNSFNHTTLDYIKMLLSGNVIGEIIYKIAMPSRNILLSRCERDFYVDSTAVLIALKINKNKTGKLPDSLDVLVPEYLPEVPVDLFSGQPIKYSDEKKIIYSVGEDFKDSGGKEDDIAFEIEF